MRLLSERCWLHKCFCFHGDQILVVCSPFKMPDVCIFHGVVRVFIQKSGFWLYSRGCIAFPVFHWMHAVMQNCGTCFCDILDMYECFVTVWSRQLLASLADVKSPQQCFELKNNRHSMCDQTLCTYTAENCTCQFRKKSILLTQSVLFCH